MVQSELFAAMLRVKNEARWIDRVIDALLPLCARIFVLDDHSTDNTAEICAAYKEAAVFRSPFHGFNEARDKNWLLQRVMENCDPAWIACVDGDEILEPGGAEKIRAHVEAEPCHAYSFQIVYLWNDWSTARVDRIYGEFWRPSLFRPYRADPSNPDSLKIAQELTFMATPFGRKVGNDEPNLHCSSVPQRLLHGHKRCPTKLLHLGYMLREDRVRKLDFYTAHDWKNRAEDSYRHMTQGDFVKVEELPRTQELLRRGIITQADVDYAINVSPDDYLVHAGPIKLEAVQWQAV